MALYKFKKERELSNPYDTTTVEITCDTVCLDELLTAFEEFLYACGFGERKLVVSEDEE